MERRSQSRAAIDQPVRLTLLGDAENVIEGRIVNVSVNGVRLVTDRALRPGLPVKLEWGQTLLLGEVCYCQWQNGHFAIGLELEHALYDTAELARLANRLLGRPAEETIPAPVRTREKS